MYFQVRFLAPIPCDGCRRGLIREGTDVEPVGRPDGMPYEYDENNPPKNITLALRCMHCGHETRFIRNGANTEVIPQPNPPNITTWSPYVVAEA